ELRFGGGVDLQGRGIVPFDPPPDGVRSLAEYPFLPDLVPVVALDNMIQDRRVAGHGDRGSRKQFPRGPGQASGRDRGKAAMGGIQHLLTIDEKTADAGRMSVLNV